MEFADYDLEVEKAVKKIKDEDAKKVLIQLPDGLKLKAKDIVDYLHKETDAEVMIYMGACFGACDFPTEITNMGFDLLIAWGHSKWRY